MENRVGQSQDKIGVAILQKDSQGRRLLCTRESCRQIWQFLFPFFDLIGLILELADPVAFRIADFQTRIAEISRSVYRHFLFDVFQGSRMIARHLIVRRTHLPFDQVPERLAVLYRLPRIQLLQGVCLFHHAEDVADFAVRQMEFFVGFIDVNVVCHVEPPV